MEFIDDSVNEPRTLGKELIERSLEELNKKLANASESGEIVIFGGAAMCLVYGNREYTRDIDAIFQPKSNIYKYAKEIAKELNISENWINDGVKGWLYKEPETSLIYNFTHLKVYVASPEYILAMKCFAARQDTDDRNDALYLVKHLKLTNRDEVLDIVEKFIPNKYLSVKNVAFAEGLFDEK